MPFPRGAESTGGEDPIPYVSLKTKEEGKRACSCQLSCYLKKVTSVFGAWFRCIVKLTLIKMRVIVHHLLFFLLILKHLIFCTKKQM